MALRLDVGKTASATHRLYDASVPAWPAGDLTTDCEAVERSTAALARLLGNSWLRRAAETHAPSVVAAIIVKDDFARLRAVNGMRTATASAEEKLTLCLNGDDAESKLLADLRAVSKFVGEAVARHMKSGSELPETSAVSLGLFALMNSDGDGHHGGVPGMAGPIQTAARALELAGCPKWPGGSAFLGDVKSAVRAMMEPEVGDSFIKLIYASRKLSLAPAESVQAVLL
eukprot:Polyplicarium_translucidae@DN1093_c0_g1_i2.p1